MKADQTPLPVVSASVSGTGTAASHSQCAAWRAAGTANRYNLRDDSPKLQTLQLPIHVKCPVEN